MASIAFTLLKRIFQCIYLSTTMLPFTNVSQQKYLGALKHVLKKSPLDGARVLNSL